MYKRNSKKKLGRKSTHRKALINNLLRSLFTNGKVETTTPKAKVLKSKAGRVIARAKRNGETLSGARYLTEVFGKRELAEKVVEYAKKDNTIEIVKIGFRAGDNAEKSRVTLTGFKGKKVEKKDIKKDSKKKEVKKETTSAKKVVNTKKEAVKAAPVKQARSRTRSGL
jgi:large subunit ribosomal protein L17